MKKKKQKIINKMIIIIHIRIINIIIIIMIQKIIIHMEEKNIEEIREEINTNMMNIQIKISKNII